MANIPLNTPGTNLAVKPKTAVKKPKLYKVLLLNDDYTPMDFVVKVLEKFFQKDHDEAKAIMMHVHENGVGLCGVFPFDVAETKAIQVIEYARAAHHPLQCAVEAA